MNNKIKFIKNIFNSNDKNTHFDKMILKPEYFNSLFIFNDYFTKFINNSSDAGCGNAIIRPYKYNQSSNKIAFNNKKIGLECGEAFGIPTGDDNPNISDNILFKDGIFPAFISIYEKLKNGFYDKIIFSVDNNNNFAFCIFNPSQNIKNIINYGFELLCKIFVENEKELNFEELIFSQFNSF